jgi:SAM-dependent methyltransferase
MPDAADLKAMYGASYGSVSEGHGVADPKEPGWVLEWLSRLPPGSFVDYGCAGGELLTAAAARDWSALGVELAEEVVEETSRRTGLPVLTVEEARRRRGFADVLHLGDVLEHLTDVEREMPLILSLLKPGGLLLAQGPLEANGNLFTWTLRAARAVRGSRIVEASPYHTILATVEGQWALFRRFGFAAIEARVTEVSWPAPGRIGLADLARPRELGLFSLRLASRALSRFRPGRWGNRYCYAGRQSGSPQLLNPRTHQ